MPLASAFDWRLIPLTALVGVAACSSDRAPVASGQPAAAPAAMTCADIATASLNIPGLVVASAVANPASGAAGVPGSYPAHCQIRGAIGRRTAADGRDYAIGYDIRLPTPGWNGRFLYAGDAGLDGAFREPLGTNGLGGDPNALALGYAVASSDGGHTDAAGGFDGSFGQDPQARVDYAYNALGTLTVAAKQVVGQFYGTAPARSYYVGCSKGGESGLMAASRFADQFDGIVAGDPGMDLPQASIAEMHDTQQLAKVDPDLAKAFAPRDLALVSSRILARCDALDGAADGMVNDLAACRAAFNPERDLPVCAPGRSPDGSCLSAVQKTALNAIFAGAKSSRGEALYADWPWDPGLVGANWSLWKTVLNPNLGVIAMGNVWAVPPVPTIAPFSAAAAAYWRGFDLDAATALIHRSDATFARSAMDLMAMPDPTHLPALRAHGKLIVYHGTADPIFSVNHTIAWYERLSAADADARRYARLFLVPGMNHCGGGPATDRFDVLTPLVNWVERGQAPDSVVATIAADNADRPPAWSAARSRPLCAYPLKAVLKAGATDLESAGSFTCR